MELSIMPNQRSKDVAHLSVYLNIKLIEQFKERCKADNLTMTEALMRLIKHYIDQLKKAPDIGGFL
jgi:hypothetical protein